MRALQNYAKNTIGQVVLVTILILLVPLVAMQFSNQVNWDITDLIIAGILLFGAGLVFNFVARKSTNPVFRVIVSIVIIAMLFLIWAELAVGLFGSPWAGS